MNKRIIILILSAVFLLCPMSTYADDAKTDDEQKFSLLESLDIMCGLNYDESAFRKEITKAGYVNFIMNIAFENKYTEDYDKNILQDAQNMGLISSAEEIKEDDKLSINEALTIAVRLLGYELDAERNGGFPAGYFSAANENGLLDSVKYSIDDKVTYSQAVEIIYNITEADCLTYELTGNGYNVDYSKAANALEIFRDIYRVRGIVTDNGVSSLYGASELTEDYVKIGETDYLSGKSGAGDFLGHDVLAYVKENDDMDEVVFVWDKTKSVLTIDAENVSAVTDNLKMLEYYESEESTRIKNAKIKSDAAFMLNGAAYSGCTETDFKKEGTKIVLIDRDGDGRYDFVNLESYDTIVVEAVSVSSQKIYNEYTFNADLKELDLSRYNDSDIKIFKNGKEAGISDIEKGDVLAIFEINAESGEKIKIYADTETVTGKAESYSESRGEIVVNGKTYKISDLYKTAREKNDSAAKTVSSGSEYLFRLNRDGKIVFAIRAADGEEIYAYLTKFVLPRQSAGEESYYMTLFTEEGAWVTARLADKVNVNGASRKDENADINGEITACVNKDIIGVKFNKNGEISHIKTPTDYYDGIDTALLNRDTGVNGKTYRYNETTFSNYYYMDGNTKVFIVPKDSTDEKSLYRIGTNYSFKSNNIPAGTVTGYNRDEYYNLDIVLWSSPGTNMKEVGNTLYMVKEKGLMSNSDGEVVPYINAASETYAGVTFEGESVNSGLESVDVGDVIQIHVNSNGRIDNCTLLYDVSAGDVSKKALNGSLGGEDYTLQGAVLKKDISEGMLLLDTVSEVAFRLPASKAVLIYDKETREVSVGTINDISIGDFVVIDLSKNKTSMAAVYKGLDM